MEKKESKRGAKSQASWTTIDITEEEISKNWRVLNTQTFSGKRTVVYYCVAGKKACPAKIKKEEYANGKIEYQSNGESHGYHREMSGLTKEQKEFVMKAPVQRPDDILKLFKLEGVDPPPKNKLKHFLQWWRATLRQPNRSAPQRKNKTQLRKVNVKTERESSPEPQDTNDAFDDFEDTNYESMETSPVPEPELPSRLRESTNDSETFPRDDIVSLKWDSQLDHIKSALCKMYDDATGQQTLTDVTLVSSEGETIEAHQLLMSMSSPYFQRLFKKVQESKKAVGNTIIILDNVKVSLLKSLLRFIYTGQVDVSTSDVEELRRLGNLFEINGLSTSEIGSSKRPFDLSSSTNHSQKKSSSPSVGNNEDEDNDECFNDTELDDFDEYHTRISEDEGAQFSESDIKVESCQSITEQEKDEILNLNAEGEVPDVITVKIQTSTESSAGRTETQNEMRDKQDELRLNPTTGLLETVPKRGKGNWKEIEPPSKEYLKENWCVRNKGKRGVHMFYILYYCQHGGKRCPARLKMEIFVGKKTFYVNDKDHANHRTEPRGLSELQKNFIEKQLEMNVRQPNAILQAMEKDGTIRMPNRRQIHNYIMWQKAKYEQISGLYLIKNKRKIGRPPNPKAADGDDTASLPIRTARR